MLMHQDVLTGSTDGAQPHECEEKMALLLPETVDSSTENSSVVSREPLSQKSGELETSLYLLSAEVIAGLLTIDRKPAAALKHTRR